MDFPMFYIPAMDKGFQMEITLVVVTMLWVMALIVFPFCLTGIPSQDKRQKQVFVFTCVVLGIACLFGGILVIGAISLCFLLLFLWLGYVYRENVH
jgi:hypothetical protein